MENNNSNIYFIFFFGFFFVLFWLIGFLKLPMNMSPYMFQLTCRAFLRYPQFRLIFYFTIDFEFLLSPPERGDERDQSAVFFVRSCNNSHIQIIFAIEQLTVRQARISMRNNTKTINNIYI